MLEFMECIHQQIHIFLLNLSISRIIANVVQLVRIFLQIVQLALFTLIEGQLIVVVVGGRDDFGFHIAAGTAGAALGAAYGNPCAEAVAYHRNLRCGHQTADGAGIDSFTRLGAAVAAKIDGGIVVFNLLFSPHT